MEGIGRKGNVVRIVGILLVVMTMLVSTSSTLIKVGGSHGWTPNYNYTEWSSQNNFYVGYWLIFNFDKRYYNILEVNKTNYESCNDKEFIKNITQGGRDVVQLTEARPYYYLSSGGYCWHGMKLAIIVQEQLPPSPAPQPAANSSPTLNMGNQGVLGISLLLAFWVWFILIKE